MDRLFLLIQQSWENASDRYRERLLHLIGKIGRDDRTGKTANKVRPVAYWCVPQLHTHARTHAGSTVSAAGEGILQPCSVQDFPQ